MGLESFNDDIGLFFAALALLRQIFFLTISIFFINDDGKRQRFIGYSVDKWFFLLSIVGVIGLLTA